MTARSSHGAHTLAGPYYTCPEVYARESTSIFEHTWLCLIHTSRIAENSVVAVRIENESLLATRNADQYRVFYNVCAHRGTRLVESTGCQACPIVCPYHGWTYDVSGRLKSAPQAQIDGIAMNAMPSNNQPGLREVTADVALGYIWVRFSTTGPTLSGFLQPLLERATAWPFEQLSCQQTLEYEIAANWKVVLQNFNECYHCPRVHPALQKLTRATSARNDLAHGTILGGPMSLEPEAKSLTLDGHPVGEPFAGLTDRQRREVRFYSVFPTTTVSLHPDYVMVHRLRRVSSNVTHIACDFLSLPTLPAEALTSAVQFWDLTNRQDWRMCERTQLGVASRGYRTGPYTDAESVLAEIDRVYLQALDSASDT